MSFSRSENIGHIVGSECWEEFPEVQGVKHLCTNFAAGSSVHEVSGDRGPAELLCCLDAKSQKIQLTACCTSKHLFCCGGEC